MRLSALAVLFSVMLFSIPASSRAQERGHAAFVFGWTFGEETSSLYGAQFGAGVGRGFSIVGGVESLQDALTGRYALFLHEIASLPGVDVAAEIPGVYYGFGLRWSVPGAGVSPFAQVELGATKVSPEIAFTLNEEELSLNRLSFAVGARF